jgi:uncharacterized protein DUF1161
MKTIAAISVLLLAPGFAAAQAKSCDDLKSEIAKKIEANGVTSYSLDIMDKDAQTDGKVVGTCGGGTKKIVYSKTAASGDNSAPAQSSAPSTPASK